MPTLRAYDQHQLDQTLLAQHFVIRRGQAQACGLTAKAIWHRIKPGGPWRVVLPGVYAVGGGGALSDIQRDCAAWLFADRAIAITGLAAVAVHGIPANRPELVDILVPWQCRRTDVGFVRFHRTTIKPAAVFTLGPVRYADPARAVADAARQLPDLADVRAVVSAGVQRGKVEISQLTQVLDAGPMRGSARLRIALAEVADGVRSVAEADLRSLVKKAGLPTPLYNPRLYLDGRFLACPDVWWPDAGVAVEVDSRAYHLSAADWEKTMARHNRMVAAGILLLHFPPTQIRKDGRAVIHKVRSTLATGHGPLARITTEACASARLL
jgi:hypothetical protein